LQKTDPLQSIERRGSWEKEISIHGVSFFESFFSLKGDYHSSGKRKSRGRAIFPFRVRRKRLPYLALKKEPRGGVRTVAKGDHLQKERGESTITRRNGKPREITTSRE